MCCCSKEQIVEAFNAFDQNHDGFVDLSEATAMMATKGVSADKVEVLFRRADIDQDNRLNYTEFAIFWDVSVY